MTDAGARAVPVVVIGGGQAGLAMSHCLKRRGIEHLVLERDRLGHDWRERRWDSFCLVTPNWQCQLPGFPYQGPDPQGFMKKDEIVAYLEAYARAFQPPLREGVTVTGLHARPAGFELATSAGTLHAGEVVVATGGYHRPAIPRLAERLPRRLLQLHSSQYHSPGALPAGEVLVVGSGQSGCQIAEDLHIAGRRVHLCVGSAPRTARRYRGKDVVEWLEAMGYYRMPVHEHPLKERVRAKANHYVTGRDGGRDIDLRALARAGMHLHGRLEDVEVTEAGEVVLSLADDLRHNLDQADAVAGSIKDTIDRFIAAGALAAPPPEPRYVPVWEPPALSPAQRRVRLADTGITSVVWSTGFHRDYRFVELPVFDGKGEPVHQRGVTGVPGLYFLGLPWLYTWGSGRFSGVGQDAEHLATCIEQRLGALGPAATPTLNELALGS
jgi:putative flavoprotein involved in K+ transport